MLRAFTVALLLVAVGLVAAMVSPPIARDAHAQDVTIYRCTDADGAVTLQNNAPCPKGMKQEVRVLGGVPTVPATTTVIPTVAHPVPGRPAATDPASTTPVASERPMATEAAPPQRLPPPALFQCRSWDDHDYLGDVAEPPGVCVPIETMGIDGSSTLAAGSACEMRRDACTEVPQDQLCAAWSRRVAEAEFRWKYAGSGNDERRAEYERVAGIHNRSTCTL